LLYGTFNDKKNTTNLINQDQFKFVRVTNV